MNWRMTNCWQLAGCSLAVCFLVAHSAIAQTVPTRTIRGQIEEIPSAPMVNPPLETNESDLAQSKLAQSRESQKLSEIELTASSNLPTPRRMPAPVNTTTFEPPAIGTLYQWESSSAVDRKVLFEDPQLERYGCTRHARLQPAISGLKFFKDGALFPAQLILRRHR